MAHREGEREGGSERGREGGREAVDGTDGTVLPAFPTLKRIKCIKYHLTQEGHLPVANNTLDKNAFYTCSKWFNLFGPKWTKSHSSTGPWSAGLRSCHFIFFQPGRLHRS